jgi:hypothetical protein
MNTIKKIEQNLEQILPVLYEWAETFDLEFDEDGEKTIEPYNEIFLLARRLEYGECNENDFKNVLFHIQQINYNEIKIQL